MIKHWIRLTLNHPDEIAISRVEILQNFCTLNNCKPEIIFWSSWANVTNMMLLSSLVRLLPMETFSKLSRKFTIYELIALKFIDRLADNQLLLDCNDCNEQTSTFDYLAFAMNNLDRFVSTRLQSLQIKASSHLNSSCNKRSFLLSNTLSPINFKLIDRKWIKSDLSPWFS